MIEFGPQDTSVHNYHGNNALIVAQDDGWQILNTHPQAKCYANVRGIISFRIHSNSVMYSLVVSPLYK